MTYKNKRQVIPINKALTDDWNLWLTLETVIQLKKFPLLEMDLSVFTEERFWFDQTPFFSITQQFHKKVERVRQRINFSENRHSGGIGYFQLEVEQFYQEILEEELKKVRQDVKLQADAKVKEFYSKDIKQASPENIIMFLEKLTETLFLLREKQEHLKCNFLELETSASRAFNILFDDSKENALNALRAMYNSKLLKEIFSIKSDVYFHMIRLCQSYSEISRGALVMLENIEMSLKDKCSLDLTDFPIFTSLKRLEPMNQRKLIEDWLGQSINYWHFSEYNWQQIEDQLLQNIEQEELAQELYLDLKAYFSEHEI